MNELLNAVLGATPQQTLTVALLAGYVKCVV